MTSTVIISGGTSGIGLATAQAFASAGWRVLAIGLPSPKASTLAEYGNVRVVACDLTDLDAVHEMLQTHANLWQAEGLGALINNVGVTIPAPLETITLDSLRAQFEINLFAHLRLIQALLPALRVASGRIINVSSMMGQVALPLLGGYSMTKHALEGMTDALRLEVAGDGVAVVSVAMGAVATPLTEGMVAGLDNILAQDERNTRYARLFDAMRQTLQAQARRAITPEDVASVIYKATTTRKPKARYTVDAPARGLILMRRLAPEDVGDWILRRALRIRK